MTVLRISKNGGVTMVIKPDGTKIRWGENPEMPESIDLKITDHCDAGCKFCHESSTPKGIHGNSGWIYNLIGQCIRGSELAIGGGNPLDHPDLEKILLSARSRGVYANLTVNHKHIADHRIYQWLRQELINGLGISVDSGIPRQHEFFRMYSKYSNRIVFHLILGVHHTSVIKWIKSEVENPKILLLGFKDFGFGAKQKVIKARLEYDIENWQDYLSRRNLPHISFDNLAIDQLNLREIFPEEMETGYMGDDGQHTMYVDAVTQQYAIGSTGERYNCYDMSLVDMFSHVKNLAVDLRK